MKTVPKEKVLLRPPQLSIAMLIQLIGVASVWAAIFTHRYFGEIVLLLFVIATILGVLSQLAYCYVWRHRLTPLVVSHALCLLGLVLYGGILSPSVSVSEKFAAVSFIAAGPFAYGMSTWKIFLSPVVITTFAASALGLGFRPSVISAHLLSIGSVYWYMTGFVMLVFAGLGT